MNILGLAIIYNNSQRLSNIKVSPALRLGASSLSHMFDKHNKRGRGGAQKAHRPKIKRQQSKRDPTDFPWPSGVDDLPRLNTFNGQTNKVGVAKRLGHTTTKPAPIY